jgi:hypothetical protein
MNRLPPVCPSGKICHQTQKRAERHAQHLNKPGEHARVYYCAHCDCWHVTRQSKRQHKTRQVLYVRRLAARRMTPSATRHTEP